MATKWKGNLTRENASKMHKEVFALLKQTFPHHTIYQEFKIDVTEEGGGRHFLYLDFFVPDMFFAIECQGRQHFESNTHFHPEPGDFDKQKHRDSLKKRWCDLNDIGLVEISYRDKLTKEELMKRIAEVI
jgi:hypothetical protein